MITIIFEDKFLEGKAVGIVEGKAIRDNKRRSLLRRVAPVEQ
jgi:hypothetical protein